jgi:hypothetical protein
MKKLILITLFITTNFMTNKTMAFTLNPDTGKGFKKNDIDINIASTDCSGAGFSTQTMASMVKDAVNDYWNQVPTSALYLKSKGISSSIDIDGDDFDDALNKAQTNTILAGCNDDVPDFSNSSILGAAVMDCNGENCKAVLILNANNSALQNMTRAERVAVIAHELGHAFGLGHSEYTHNLMYYSASGKKQKWLGEDDIDGVSYLYPHDSELAGLIGSCGTITTDDDAPSNFQGQFLLGLVISVCILNFRRLSSFGKTSL